MSADFENDPEFNDAIAKPSSRRGFRLVELLVVLGIIAILIALLLPAVRTAGPAARRAQCTNNLKQIALALHNYEQAYNALPPAYTVDAEGRPLHSWRTLILPYLEQGPLYQTIDLSKPWNDPANAKALETVLPVFRCPEAVGPQNTTTYLAIAAPNGCLIPRESRRLAEITDAHDVDAHGDRSRRGECRPLDGSGGCGRVFGDEPWADHKTPSRGRHERVLRRW